MRRPLFHERFGSFLLGISVISFSRFLFFLSFSFSFLILYYYYSTHRIQSLPHSTLRRRNILFQHWRWRHRLERDDFSRQTKRNMNITHTPSMAFWHRTSFSTTLDFASFISAFQPWSQKGVPRKHSDFSVLRRNGRTACIRGKGRRNSAATGSAFSPAKRCFFHGSSALVSFLFGLQQGHTIGSTGLTWMERRTDMVTTCLFFSSNLMMHSDTLIFGSVVNPFFFFFF